MYLKKLGVNHGVNEALHKRWGLKNFIMEKALDWIQADIHVVTIFQSTSVLLFILVSLYAKRDKKQMHMSLLMKHDDA